MHADVTVIGGGIVGLSIAYGLLLKGQSVICVDGSDYDFRASRGNFGLVWVQSKGIGHPEYAAWTQQAVKLYQPFIEQLQQHSSIEVSYKQTGGYEYFLDEKQLEQKAEQLFKLKEQLNGQYPIEVFDTHRIRQEEPALGDQVVGATYFPEDGHTNPLQLLHALLVASNRMGLEHITSTHVVDQKPNQNGYTLFLSNGRQISSTRVVVAAGLGAKTLGPMFGFKGLVSPQRGQVLITEKLPKLLNRPSLTLRQVNEGGIQIGDSKENVGLNDSETRSVIATIAQRAARIMPQLKDVRLVRTWAALRVMSPDGLPIYEKSKQFPGVSLITCHSGISLAAAHASLLTDWILDEESSLDLTYFGEDRF